MLVKVYDSIWIKQSSHRLLHVQLHFKRILICVQISGFRDMILNFHLWEKLFFCIIFVLKLNNCDFLGLANS